MEINEDDYKRLLAYQVATMKKVIEIENALSKRHKSTSTVDILQNLDYEAFSIMREIRLPMKDD